MSITLTCAKCGAEDSIVADDVVQLVANAASWDMSPDGMTLEPEWEGGSDVDWDTQRPRDPKWPYCCSECGKSYSPGQLVGLIKKEEDDES